MPTSETPMSRHGGWTVCLTFDFDALSVWLASFPPATPAKLSRGEYGARVGVPRILALLESYKIPATFFIPGHTADSYPSVVETILAAGHEIAHHGYSHRDPSTMSPDEERRDLELGLAALERFLARQPIGYRSPSGDCSSATLSLLVEYGFRYDSSLFADDYCPYHPRIGDRVNLTQPLRPGEETSLWEFPIDYALDDWPHFTFNFDPLRVGLSAPSKVFEIWAGDFDYLADRQPDGVLTLTMHPQVIGRGHRMALLERFIEHALARGGGQFARMGDVAGELSKRENP